MEIDFSKFKPFQLGKIFNIGYGTDNELNHCQQVNDFCDTAVNFVSRSAYSNGVTAKILPIEGLSPLPTGLISVAGGGSSVLSTFLQDSPFYSGRDILILTPIDPISDLVKYFIITLIEHNKYKYSFGRQANSSLPFIEIELPVKCDDNQNFLIDKTCRYSNEGYIPDYEFMDNYMKELKGDISNIPEYFMEEGNKKACWYLDNINNEKFEKEYAGILKQNNIHLIDRTWKKKQVKDIFIIINGKGLTNSELEENPGDLIAIQSGAENNGVFGYIDKNYCVTKGYIIINEPCLVVARVGSSGFVSYQNNGCVVGDKAKALLLKEHKSKYVFLFLTTILNALKVKYGYGVRGVAKETYLDEWISLPVDDNDNVDWQFMEDYVKSLPFSANL